MRVGMHEAIHDVGRDPSTMNSGYKLPLHSTVQSSVRIILTFIFELLIEVNPTTELHRTGTQ